MRQPTDFRPSIRRMPSDQIRFTDKQVIAIAQNSASRLYRATDDFADYRRLVGIAETSPDTREGIRP